jgi:hypothetical protein
MTAHAPPTDDTPNRLEQLRVNSRHAHERRDLYRAKVYGPRAANLNRLQELERACELADRLLRGAVSEDARLV